MYGALEGKAQRGQALAQAKALLARELARGLQEPKQKIVGVSEKGRLFHDGRLGPIKWLDRMARRSPRV